MKRLPVLKQYISKQAEAPISRTRSAILYHTSMVAKDSAEKAVLQLLEIQQRKKLWTNLKQTQRDIITKERQARFAIGVGPETPSSELDPNVALIAPNLMAVVPTLFSSNMNDDEIENHKQIVQDINDSTIELDQTIK
ncbi:hypothetical protein G5I_04509 [Acromyrmex echinatior]|uniref:Uncharacterized protein n=1 Tax=Acromyrmex echinatior TaxID=103372 RepID=F4WFT9_ACREC|nr:hypothetical protein G5I_04509 [Acromyrmex echinatior]